MKASGESEMDRAQDPEAKAQKNREKSRAYRERKACKLAFVISNQKENSQFSIFEYVSEEKYET